MGLDVTAYETLTPMPSAPKEGSWEEDRAVHVSNHDYPGRELPLKEGWYLPCGDKFGFRAGSYGGYNAWRNSLAVMAGYGSDKAAWEKDPSEGPFIELINFSDCEGFLGPDVCKKLHADFLEWDSRAREGLDEWEYRLYTKWTMAASLGSAGGGIDFH